MSSVRQHLESPFAITGYQWNSRLESVITGADDLSAIPHVSECVPDTEFQCGEYGELLMYILRFSVIHYAALFDIPTKRPVAIIRINSLELNSIVSHRTQSPSVTASADNNSVVCMVLYMTQPDTQVAIVATTRSPASYLESVIGVRTCFVQV